jgi:hypothetical protein
MLAIFLKGRTDCIYKHKSMLYQYLDSYFLENNSINKFYPVFHRSDVKYEFTKSQQVTFTTYPGVVISFDADSQRQFQVAIYEANFTVCDLHDCVHDDILNLTSRTLNENSALRDWSLNRLTDVQDFNGVPAIPKSVPKILALPEPYRTLWIAALTKEINGFLSDDKLTPCTSQYMYDCKDKDSGVRIYTDII